MDACRGGITSVIQRSFRVEERSSRTGEPFRKPWVSYPIVILDHCPTVMLNVVKHLDTSTYALQILRFAQDDRGKRKVEKQFSDRLGGVQKSSGLLCRQCKKSVALYDPCPSLQAEAGRGRGRLLHVIAADH